MIDLLNPSDFFPPDADKCPSSVRHAIDMFLNNKIKPGAFVYACLANDFATAIHRADKYNLAKIGHIANYIHNNVPGNCCGSYDAVNSYLSDKEETDDAIAAVAASNGNKR